MRFHPRSPAITTLLKTARSLQAVADATSLLFYTGMVTLLICSASFCYQQYFVRQMHFSDVTYKNTENAWIPAKMPLYLLTEGEGIIEIAFTMELPVRYPKSLRIIPDDCLESITINDRNVESEQLPICPDLTVGHVYDLHDYLHTGTNQVRISVKDLGGLAILKIVPEYHVPFSLAKTSLYLFVALVALLVPWDKEQKETNTVKRSKKSLPYQKKRGQAAARRKK